MVVITRHTQSIQSNKFAISLQYFKIEERDESIFLHEKNIKFPYKLMLSILVIIDRHAQITQNNKFAISLQYPKIEVSDEVEFLHENKHQASLQVNDTNSGGHGQSCPK